MPRTKKVEVKEEIKQEVEQEVKNQEQEQPKTIKYSVTNKGGLRVRKEPGLDKEIIRIANYEEEVEIEEIIDNWAKVKDGYMLATYLKEV